MFVFHRREQHGCLVHKLFGTRLFHVLYFALHIPSYRGLFHLPGLTHAIQLQSLCSGVSW